MTAELGADEHLGRAERALYRARKDGRGRATFHEEPHMRDEIVRLQEKYAALRLPGGDAA